MSPPPLVRPATPDDYAACARLFEELRVPDPVWSAERFAMTVAKETLVLTDGDGDEAHGYAWARPRGDVLHVLHVVVAPQTRGRGAGRTLMKALAAQARAAGLARWMLNVKPDNLAARALYEQCGMAVAFAAAAFELAWSDVARLAGTPGLTARALAPADDAAFERACGLGPGEIASLRDAQGRVVLGAEEDGAPVAFGAFDAHFPGISPLRVLAHAHARAVFEAARPHALPGQTYLRAFAEDSPALEEALTRAGGRLVLRALRMQGDVPALSWQAAPPP